VAANQKERKRCEGEIQVQEQKISKLKDQMLQAKTNEVYRAFQNEIEFCQKEIRKFEDRILETMGESEPLEKNVKTAETALKAEKAQVETEKRAGARAHRGRRGLRARVPQGTRRHRCFDRARHLPAIRAGAQGAQGHRRGGGGGWPLHRLQSIDAASVLPGPQEGRPDSGMRVLPAHSVLQPAGVARELGGGNAAGRAE